MNPSLQTAPTGEQADLRSRQILCFPVAHPPIPHRIELLRETDIWFYCAKDITDGGSCQHLQCTGAPSAEAVSTP